MVAERLVSLAGVSLLLALCTGCAGARTTVVADEARYPVSLSRGVRDADGHLVTHERASKVATLEHSVTAWGMLYSAVRLTPRTDISTAVNEQVAAAGGDAVINLRVKGRHCPTDFIPIMSILPFWPGCASIVVEGDIIKVRPASAAARADEGAPSVAGRRAEAGAQR